MKRKQVRLKVKKLYWLNGRKSPLSLENELLLAHPHIPIPYGHMGLRYGGVPANPAKLSFKKPNRPFSE